MHCLILHVSVCMCFPAALVFYFTSRAGPENVLFILQPKASRLFHDDYLSFCHWDVLFISDFAPWKQHSRGFGLWNCASWRWLDCICWPLTSVSHPSSNSAPFGAAQLDRLTNQPSRPVWFGWFADDVTVSERNLQAHMLAFSPIFWAAAILQLFSRRGDLLGCIAIKDELINWSVF